MKKTLPKYDRDGGYYSDGGWWLPLLFIAAIAFWSAVIYLIFK